MILRVCAFSDAGRRLAARIAAAFPDEIVDVRDSQTPLDAWVADAFASNLPLIFVGACGIAVRAVAPFVKDKTLDSPVVVVDERGRYAIPILSGHLGGANRLAEELARRIGAEAVVTTATDVNGLFAVDVFAAENAFHVENRDGIVRVSSKLLAGERIDVSIDPKIEYPREDVPAELRLRESPPTAPCDVLISESAEFRERATLRLAPKTLVLGVGCRKGVDADAIERLAADRLAAIGAPGRWDRVAAVASVDLKRREYGLALFAARIRAPFVVYSAEELAAVEGDFSESSFVREVVGVANVCERAALREAGSGAKLLAEKAARDGVTVAIAERKAVVKTWKRRSTS